MMIQLAYFDQLWVFIGLDKKSKKNYEHSKICLKLCIWPQIWFNLNGLYQLKYKYCYRDEILLHTLYF
jgi:hypothetical protein